SACPTGRARKRRGFADSTARVPKEQEIVYVGQESGMEIAYSLASEELHPTDMVHAAKRAEELGFQSVWLSDHFHPWTDRQGQSPFVWSVIGGIAATTGLRVGTAVTC